MAFFPNTTVKIERSVKTGVSDVGSPIYELAVINPSLSVTLQKDEQQKTKNVIHYDDVGQTTLSLYTMICTTFLDIRSEDLVTDLRTNEIFRVCQKPYIGALITHIFCTLKLGTE